MAGGTKGHVNRRRFIQAAAGGLFLPAAARAGLITRDFSRRPSQSGGGGGSGFTPESGIEFSGTFADGESVTFTRAAGGFGTKTNVKPLWYFPLDSDLNAHPTLSRNTGSLSPDSSSTIQSSIKPTNATNSARVRACTSATQSPAPILFQDPFTITGSHMYAFIKRYRADGAARAAASGVLESKAIRLWTTAAPGTPDIYNGQGPTGGSSFVEGVDAPVVTVSGSPVSHFHNESEEYAVWRTYEHFLQCSSDIDTNDGIWNTARNGSLYHDILSRWKTPAPGASKVGYLDEYSNSDGDSFDYFHCVYIDDSPLRIWISDESSYDQDVTLGGGSPVFWNREICIPTAWSDTEVTATVRKGAFSDLVGVHAYLGTDLYSAIKLGVGSSP